MVRDARSGRTNQPKLPLKFPARSPTARMHQSRVCLSFGRRLLAKEDAQLKRQFTAKIRYYSSRTGDMMKGAMP